jgi:hypothetical protein
MNHDLDALLRSALTAESERTMSLTDTDSQHERLQERLGRDRRGRRITLVSLGAAATVAAVLGAAALLVGGDSSTGLEAPPATQPPTAPAAPAVVLVETPLQLPTAAVVATGKVASAPLRHNLAFAAGSLWTVSSSGTSLQRVDPRTAATGGTIPLQLPPGTNAESVTASGTSLVVFAAPPDHATDGDTSKPNSAYLVVDTAQGRQTASVPAYVDLGQNGNRVAVGLGGTWVQSSDKQLAELDTATGRLGRRLAVPTAINGFAVGSDALWVPSYDEGVFTRVALADGRATTTPVGPSTINAAAVGSDGIVWRSGRLQRLTGTPPALGPTVELAYGQGGKADFAAIDSTLYCVCGIGGQLAVVDGSFTAAKAYEVPGSGPDTSIAAGGGRLWLLLPDGTLTGLDPAAL